MQALVFDIKRFAVHDGPGIRTTVFLKGCPLNCAWCHNPEGISPNVQTVVKTIRVDGKEFKEEEIIGTRLSVEQVLTEVLKEKVFMDSSEGGVTFSGGEPLMQPAFLKALLVACKKEGLHTAVDTSGYAKLSVIQDIAAYTDLFLYDLKLMDDQAHQFFTAVSNKLILDNLIYLLENRHPLRIRIPVIPEVNFNQENTTECLQFLAAHPGNIQGVDLLPYHNMANQKYLRFKKENSLSSLQSLPNSSLTKIREQFERAGFETKIGG
ncbi:MAG: glycyl-radical enzyme activating protein [Bacteroidales bacterium]|nr:glycyl-radical enzyme activating protein [Bacteroidales bacterium]